MFKPLCHNVTIVLLFLSQMNRSRSDNVETDDATTKDDHKVIVEVLNFKPDELPYGENVTMLCKSRWPGSNIFWTFKNPVTHEDVNITDDNNGYKLEMRSENKDPESGETLPVSILHIVGVNFTHVGTYVCHARSADDLDICTVPVNITLPGKITYISPIRLVKMHEKLVELVCVAEGYPFEYFSWYKNSEQLEGVEGLWDVQHKNETLHSSTLTIREITRKDNGTYTCLVSAAADILNASTTILVLEKPMVRIDIVKPIGTNKVFLNWTVNDGNDANHLHIVIQYMALNDTTWYYYPEKTQSLNNSCVLRNIFRYQNVYRISVTANNSQGSDTATSEAFELLPEDPVFIPVVQVNGVTFNSITIKWESPTSPVLREHVHYYKLLCTSLEVDNYTWHALHDKISKDNLYLFSDLEPATLYSFQVAACSEYSGECGPYSESVNGITMDGIAEPPSNVSIDCRYDMISEAGFIYISWNPPVKPRGSIMSYNVHLEGMASFINELGVEEQTSIGPKVKSVASNTFNTRFNNITANTNYTVKVSAVTRTKRNGQPAVLNCQMAAVLPEKHHLNMFSWQKVSQEDVDGKRWLFRLYIPRLSQRRGPISCYRVYIIRMEIRQKLDDLPYPSTLHVVTYQEAHRTPKHAAYLADAFSNVQLNDEILLGDGVFNDVASDPLLRACGSGLIAYQEEPQPVKHASIDSAQPPVFWVTGPVSDDSIEEDFVLNPFDGPLDIGNNYTGFVEIMVLSNNEWLAGYSNYFPIRNAGPDPVSPHLDQQPTNMLMQVLCSLFAIVILLVATLYSLHHYTKQSQLQPIDIPFRTSFRTLRGRQRLVSANPPDMTPISKGDLTSAYLERHRDSDYGFQQEFELLPDRFSDRTTKASDARENVYKNRYPDIKAYDQTRVKLQQIDSITGSDYINANFVVSYKERKKFVCAQGPMDTTLNDFWRMIYEQHLEIIVMLTNLEEYSKTKCAKYWPEEGDNDKLFGLISVSHIQEKRFSEYILRTMHIHRINNNTKATKEERVITQYHYFLWKDFMAPEHPNGILKLIKRINEAYSVDRGPILVHCSAGVGRTGTLVALDSLIEQLRDEGHVTIFNTICDLRHQRNFLVQSLKQYIFIYRALAELDRYGDTEIDAKSLKSTVEEYRIISKGSTKCKLEEQYENIINVFEDRKLSSVGNAEENRSRNRSDIVIPFDRNRVILAPHAGGDQSTYINASFVEGYDNMELFIVTQDPLESTINDFWRMIAEQNISVIVMMSEHGDSPHKCPRYWPEDEEAVYDQIIVRYAQAESCPYYTRREMTIQSREGENQHVTHLQYHGWPTVDGEVPEVTRGLIELVDFCQSLVVPDNMSPSVVVHCNLGTDRSSLFIGLKILVQQLRNEQRVDVFTVVRRLRSQRSEFINSYVQYEFLHRAILNYAELRGLCETSSISSSS